MGGDSGQPSAKRVRMGGTAGNSGGVPVPVTYHHQVTVALFSVLRIRIRTLVTGTYQDPDLK